MNLGLILFIVAVVVLVILGFIFSPKMGTTSRLLSKVAEYKAFTQIIVTLAFLFASLYIILSNNYPDDHIKWAFGTAGTILGVWLKEIVG